MLKLLESMANNFDRHLEYPSFLTLDGSLFQITLPI